MRYPRNWNLLGCNCPPGCCEGPCYDLCSCAHCWNGWKGIPFLCRLKWRLHYILHRGYR